MRRPTQPNELASRVKKKTKTKTKTTANDERCVPRDLRPIRAGQVGADETTAVKVDLILLLGAPLLVVEHHDRDTDLVARTRQQLVERDAKRCIRVIGVGAVRAQEKIYRRRQRSTRRGVEARQTWRQWRQETRIR